MGKAKKIYMNEPLELLAEQTKADRMAALAARWG